MTVAVVRKVVDEMCGEREMSERQIEKINRDRNRDKVISEREKRQREKIDERDREKRDGREIQRKTERQTDKEK